MREKKVSIMASTFLYNKHFGRDWAQLLTHCTTQPPAPLPLHTPTHTRHHLGLVPVLVFGDHGSWPPPETFPIPSAFWGQGTRSRRFSGEFPCRPSLPSRWMSSCTRAQTQTARAMLVFMVPLGASSPRDWRNERLCSGNGDKHVPGGDIWNTDQHTSWFFSSRGGTWSELPSQTLLRAHLVDLKCLDFASVPHMWPPTQVDQRATPTI